MIHAALLPLAFFGAAAAAPVAPLQLVEDSPLAEPRAGSEKNRNALQEVNLRYRRLSVPMSVMDIWYFDSDDEGANPFERPRPYGFTAGIEYVLKPAPSNWIFYYEYGASLMDEGYWDDVDEPAQHDDGDWVEPVGLGLHVLGINYAHEVNVTSDENSVWLSFLFGAGLGVGFVTGELRTWHPGSSTANTAGCEVTSPAYVRKDICDHDDLKRIPGVLPMVDITGSARINFGGRGTLRIDGGIHTLLYWGIAGGVVF